MKNMTISGNNFIIQTPGRYHLLAGGHSGGTTWYAYVNGSQAASGNMYSTGVYLNLRKNDSVYFTANHPNTVVGFAAVIILEP